MNNARIFISRLCFSFSALFLSSAHADIYFNSGGSANLLPFNYVVDYQQVYASSLFNNLNGEQIVGMRFAVNKFFGAPFDVSITSIEITLSTTTTGPTSITGLSGVGSDVVVVHSGPLHLSSAGNGQFDINIPFATGFKYFPGHGNLLLEIQKDSSEVLGTFLDAGFSPIVGRAYDIDNLNGYHSIGATQGYGLSTLFLTSAVPEPMCLHLISLGALLMGFKFKIPRRGPNRQFRVLGLSSTT